MLKPKEMERILVVGPKGRMEETVETLHDLKLIHIVDFQEPDEEVKLGKPLEKATEISRNLVKLRSISTQRSGPWLLTALALVLLAETLGRYTFYAFYYRIGV